MALGRHIKLTQEELVDEAARRFGADPLDYAFTCPNCGDTATLRDWKAIDDTGRAGQDCVGRAGRPALTAAGIDPARGCDWAAYGLFRGPWEITIPASDGKPVRPSWAFQLAGEPAAGGPVERILAAAVTA